MTARILAIALSGLLSTLPVTSLHAEEPKPARPPVKLVFDTDMGNDVDDVLALGMLHNLQSRGTCEILAVTVTKNDPLAVPFTDMVNTFYGRPDLPIGSARGPNLGGKSRFLKLAEAREGNALRYPHDLAKSDDAPEAVMLLRKTLAGQPDGSVVLVQVGFFNNFADLLDSKPDDVSPLPGRELIQKKVRELVMMAGAFQTIGDNNRYCEYNVINDIPSAQKLAREWPTPIVWSGFEIGVAAPFPAESVRRDFGYVKHHPLTEAYWLYQPPPHERPTWDLTAVLYAVWPDRGYFGLSESGQVAVEDDGFTRFKPGGNGRDRFLKVDVQQAIRLREAFAQLCSEPPEVSF